MADAAATRVLALLFLLFFFGSGLPPLLGTFDASLKWETNCLSAGKLLKSAPYSLITTAAVWAPMASMSVKSTPLIW